MRPDRHSHASAVHDPCCADCRKQNHTCPTEPRQNHAHFGHPAAVVLAVGDGVNDLEVALQSDDDETELTGRHTQRGQCRAFEEHAECAVENRIAVVAIASDVKQDQTFEAEIETKVWSRDQCGCEISLAVAAIIPKTRYWETRTSLEPLRKFDRDANVGLWL